MSREVGVTLKSGFQPGGRRPPCGTRGRNIIPELSISTQLHRKFVLPVSTWFLLLLLLLLLILIIIIISSSSSSSSSTLIVILMQGIYSYVPETHHVSMICTAAALQQVQFMLHVMLFPILNVLRFYIITSRNVCAVPDMSDFCSSLLHAFPVSCSDISWMTLRWFQFTQLLLVSFLCSHSTCAVFVL
jgi:hypothetical protein